MCELVWCSTMLCVVFVLYAVFSFMLHYSQKIRNRNKWEIKKYKMEKYEKIKMIIYVIQLIYGLFFLWSFSGMRRIIIYSFQSALSVEMSYNFKWFMRWCWINFNKRSLFLCICLERGTVSIKGSTVVLCASYRLRHNFLIFVENWIQSILLIKYIRIIQEEEGEWWCSIFLTIPHHTVTK